jgi:hypothetical protein
MNIFFFWSVVCVEQRRKEKIFQQTIKFDRKVSFCNILVNLFLYESTKLWKQNGILFTDGIALSISMLIR